MLALVFLLSGCGAAQTQASPSPRPSPLPQTFTVNGAITLNQGDFISAADDSCVGTGGYDDLQPGAQVVITDPTSTTVAVGQITAGSVIGDDDGIQSCVLGFKVEDVPSGKKFYGVEVTHRGRLQYSEDEVQRSELDPLKLTIG